MKGEERIPLETLEQHLCFIEKKSEVQIYLMNKYDQAPPMCGSFSLFHSLEYINKLNSNFYPFIDLHSHV